MRTRIKICGITNPDDGVMVARAGADAIGLVFWPKSPRHVALAAAREITAVVPPFVLRVGVFVDPSRDTLMEAVSAGGLDLIQLHGTEPPEAFGSLPRRGVKAIRVGPGFDVDQALRYDGRAAGLLLDTEVPRVPGGSGQTFDWSLVQELRPRASYLILAGGLNPDNVGAAIRAVRPDAVDVSSGVERAPGQKDRDKVRAFIEAVREAV